MGARASVLAVGIVAAVGLVALGAAIARWGDAEPVSVGLVPAEARPAGEARDDGALLGELRALRTELGELRRAADERGSTRSAAPSAAEGAASELVGVEELGARLARATAALERVAAALEASGAPRARPPEVGTDPQALAQLGASYAKDAAATAAALPYDWGREDLRAEYTLEPVDALLARFGRPEWARVDQHGSTVLRFRVPCPACPHGDRLWIDFVTREGRVIDARVVQ